MDEIDRIIKGAFSQINLKGTDLKGIECPSEEIMAAYLEGKLTQEERYAVQQHISSCMMCYHVLSIDKEESGLEESGQREESEFGDKEFESEMNLFKEELGIIEEEQINKDLPCVMIVDDDADYLRSLNDTLAKDYAVIPCLSGEEAIEKVNENIKSVILDIKMPGMDGLAVAKILKKSHQSIPIIFNTGYPGEYQKTRIETEYASCCYVTKDDASHLLSCLQRTV